MNMNPLSMTRARCFAGAVLAFVLALPAAAEMPSVTQVVTFTANLAAAEGSSNGAQPAFTFVETPDGKLYGQTTVGAGTDAINQIGGNGPAFAQFDPVTNSYVILARENPGTLTVSADGTIWGTTDGLRRYTPGAGWTLVRALVRATDGVGPPALWTEGPDGRLYGTDADIIFAINKDGTGLTLLHTGSVALGRSPGRLIAHSNGSLYGIALTGGEASGGTGPRGVLFRIQPDGSAYTKLHDFNGSDGSAASLPARGVLVEGAGGKLYGIVRYGENTENSDLNANNSGRLFGIDADGGNFSILHRFSRPEGNTDGRFPYSLIQSADGHLYGVALEGGIYKTGVIFRWHQSDGYQTLYSFSAISGDGINNTFPDGRKASGNQGNNDDGIEPRSLMQTHSGRFYGVTFRGGDWGWGSVFRFEPGTEVPVFKFVPKLRMGVGRTSQTGNRVAVGSAVLFAWDGENVSGCQASTTEPGSTSWSGARPFKFGTVGQGGVYDGEAYTPATLGTWDYRVTCDTPEDGPIQAQVTLSVEPVDLPTQQVGSGSGGALAPLLLALLGLGAGLCRRRPSAWR